MSCNVMYRHQSPCAFLDQELAAAKNLWTAGLSRDGLRKARLRRHVDGFLELEVALQGSFYSGFDEGVTSLWTPV